MLILDNGGDGWLVGRADSSCCPFAYRKTGVFFAAGRSSGDRCTSLAWKNIELSACSFRAKKGCEVTLGEFGAWTPPTTLVGLLLFPDPMTPRPRLMKGVCLPPLPTVSTCDAGRLPFGVPIGVVLLLSTLDFLDPDLGVTLLVMNTLAGVDSSSLVVGDLTVLGVALRADLASSGVALAPEVASRGVIGDLTLRFEASVGNKGFAGLGWLSRALWNGMVEEP